MLPISENAIRKKNLTFVIANVSSFNKESNNSRSSDSCCRTMKINRVGMSLHRVLTWDPEARAQNLIEANAENQEGTRVHCVSLTAINFNQKSPRRTLMERSSVSLCRVSLCNCATSCTDRVRWNNSISFVKQKAGCPVEDYR